jgi:hypothetical protein
MLVCHTSDAVTAADIKAVLRHHSQCTACLHKVSVTCALTAAIATVLLLLLHCDHYTQHKQMTAKGKGATHMGSYLPQEELDRFLKEVQHTKKA